MIARSDLAFVRMAAAVFLVMAPIGAHHARAGEVVLIPRIEGKWWRISGNPDLGRFTTDRQQPVDFAIWRAADGTWQLWSCIRSTAYPGGTRLFYRWEARRLTDRDWRPMGIAMTSETRLGEVEGMLQAPYVMRYHGRYLMFYGVGDHIALATSRDGKLFQRRLLPSGKVGMFTDGFGTRDPMTIRLNGMFYAYYSANPGSASDASDSSAPNRRPSRLLPNADMLRTSSDLLHWSDARIVAEGGEAGEGSSSAECPFVYHDKGSGYFYLFRTQHYGENAETRVYRSKDPANFGVDDNRDLVEVLPVAAPEIVELHGQLYIAALLPNLAGIRVAKLGWDRKP